jgi:hypothetical protein
MPTGYRFAEIPGWLTELAALVTIDILKSQEALNLNAGLFEIGVYGGKYLSLLWESAKQTASALVGVDPFSHFTKDAVLKNLGASPADEQIHLVQALSSDVSVRQLVGLLGGTARFVSIDGSHFCNDVFLDLQMAEQVIDPLGVVAVDDFLNTQCLGVVEAVVKFLTTPRALAPFLYTSNKLFMCKPSQTQYYQQIVENGIGGRDDPQSVNFKERAKSNREWLSTPFCGHSVFML